MRRAISFLLLAGSLLPACRTADRSASGVRVLDAAEPQHLYAVNKSFGDDEILELPLDPSRVIQEIVLRYDGRNVEGVRGQAYVLGADGVERELTGKLPIAPGGILTWKNASGRGGGMLVLRFAMPLVRKLPLESVLVRYK